MESNLFQVDVERIFEVLLTIVVLSLFVERALAVPFETRLLVTKLSKRGIKETIAFAVSWYLCWHWDFDALSAILSHASTSPVGHAMTAAVIAGGSKSSIRLFKGVMDTMSNAEREHQIVQSTVPHQPLQAAGPVATVPTSTSVPPPAPAPATAARPSGVVASSGAKT